LFGGRYRGYVENIKQYDIRIVAEGVDWMICSHRFGKVNENILKRYLNWPGDPENRKEILI